MCFFSVKRYLNSRTIQNSIRKLLLLCHRQAITLSQLEAKKKRPIRIRSVRCVSVHCAVCIVYLQRNSFLLLLLSLLLYTIHDSCSRMSIGHYGIIFLSKHLIHSFVVVVRLFILLHISALWFWYCSEFCFFFSLCIYIIYHVPI